MSTKNQGKNKIAAFSIADENNLKYFTMMENSLRKFYTAKELPLFLVGPEKCKEMLQKDPMFFYRATPIVASDLLTKFDTVIKIDADSVITGKLDTAWEGDFDVAVVNNSNPREHKSYPVTVWNIHPLSYVNCGFVVLKSKKFVQHWFRLCYSPHFNFYQMKEQDLLNIMVYYCPFQVKFLDSGGSFWGLASKGYWPEIKMVGDRLVLPKSEEWPDKEKVIKVIHWAGGNTPGKMNFDIHFQPEVVKKLKWLVKKKK